jgi:hypothetical protein
LIWASARLGFFPLPLAQANSRASAIFINKLDASSS